MSSLTRLSTFKTQLDVMLQKIDTSELSDASRLLAVRQAVREYSFDFPKKEVMDIPGTGAGYFMLQGNVVDVDDGLRSGSIDLTSSGADSQLGIKFTLTCRMEMRQLNLWLSRVGANVAGTLAVGLYSDSSGPGTLIATSQAVTISDADGPVPGIFRRVQFPLASPIELPVGTYHAVLSSSGYTYSAGVTAVKFGNFASTGTANQVYRWNGSAWASDASQGILEAQGNFPGWSFEGGAIQVIEYPAPVVATNQIPIWLEDEDWEIYRTQEGVWLRFIALRPTLLTRVNYTHPYQWVEASDPVIDTPEKHFEGICYLAAGACCEWLAAYYGQHRRPTINAQITEQGTQADQYLRLAKQFRSSAVGLFGQDKSALPAGMKVMDVDLGPAIGRDFIFHDRKKR